MIYHLNLILSNLKNFNLGVWYTLRKIVQQFYVSLVIILCQSQNELICKSLCSVLSSCLIKYWEKLSIKSFAELASKLAKGWSFHLKKSKTIIPFLKALGLFKLFKNSFMNYLLVKFYFSFQSCQQMGANVCLSVFVTDLLRCSSHIMQLIHLKCTIPWLFIKFTELCNYQHNLNLEYS